MDGVPALDRFDLVIEVLRSSSNQHRNPQRMCRETCRMIYHQENKPWTKNTLQVSTAILNYATSIMFPQTWSLFNPVPWFPFLKTLKRWSRSRAEVQQWDAYPGPTEFRLIGYLTESIWTPESKSYMLTPIAKSQTYWQREISHVMNGIIFCVWSTSAISVPSIVSKRFRKKHKKM